MSFLDSWTGAYEAPTSTAAAQTQRQQALFNLQQQQRGVNALQGLNLNDPASVNNALTGLAGAGQLEMAKSLNDLSFARARNQALQPLVQQGAAQALQEQQPSSQEPDDQRYSRILTDSHTALGDIINTSDPAQRQAKAAQWKTYLQNEGVPEDTIDGALGDLSEPGLRAHQAEIEQELNQYAVTHSPGYQHAKQYLESGMANPWLMGAAAGGGVDLSGGLNLAANLTSPYRNAQAGIYSAGPTAFNTTVGGNMGAAATAPQIAQAAQAHTAGTVSATPASVMGPHGETIPGSWAQGPNGLVFTQGTMNGQPIASPTLAGAQGQSGGGAANTQQATNFENYAQSYPTRKANLENLRTTAGTISTGPNAPFWSHLGALAAEYGIKTPITPTTDQTAAQEEVSKLAQMVLAQQREQMGLPNTNMSTEMATGATPHETTSPVGLQRLAGLLEGNEDYINAERQAWEAWKGKGHGYETWQQFTPQFNRMFDPRVFQAQYMDPAQKAVVRKSVKNFDTQEAVAKRLGYLGG